MKKEKRQATFTGVKFVCDENYAEIILAELGELGYNSMMETETGLEAYIETERFSEQEIKDLAEKYSKIIVPLYYTVEALEVKNWNEDWEKNYDPIIVEDQCLVRATFHQIEKKYPYEIVINPKMSFGTGHHATTYLMIKNQMMLDHQGKRVMDAGCGTGILAIMASKLGAKEVTAFDIDPWSIENAPENVALNQCQNVTVLEGTVTSVTFEGLFDIILANINKNVLLNEMKHYKSYLSNNGLLILSGFYQEDENDLVKEAKKNDLQLLSRQDRSNWSSLVFKRS